MIKPVAIDHIVLRTEYVQELVDFYCQVIGCTIERETEAELGLTQLRAGNALIDIVDVKATLGLKGGEAPRQTGNNVDHFCLQIEAFEEQALIDYLRSKGVACRGFAERYGAQGMGRSIYIKDIAGNNLELRSVQEHQTQ
ncbi:VOC family protein [Halieaceae bacterium IMCC14734]|uniref:VOC family protein n=1 Tax=Candidatus Litorirhabdus singularis TaxID=2518993 RepID=A0ABT3TJQ5_9GAMM|nr:VOC family protein [Candidatus Litorirhabdus singularis]MCX2982006.1 VOC family protein [Candidatus Litorirhabdus singularis]